MTVSADLVFAANNPAELAEVFSWDGVRPATFSLSEFPVDIVRLAGSSSPPVALSRCRRAESLKALPASLRTRAQAAFERAARSPSSLPLAHGRSLDLSAGPAVLAVVNVTPDSFSDGGLYFDTGRAVARALQLFEDGAAMVDVGGESTRPSNYGEAADVPAEEEIRRVEPVIAALRRQTEKPISIDTRKADVARAALAAGADLVNDVSGFRYDPDLPAAAGEVGAAVIVMHMRGTDPRTMQRDTTYAHLAGQVAAGLAECAARGIDAGISSDRIVVDPGLGFGKSAPGNLLLLRHLAALRSLGFPVAVGASRKGFVRRYSGVSEDSSSGDRLPGSLACLAAAAQAGAAIVRVHDVAESARFLKMLAAVRSPAARTAEPARSAAP